MTNKRHSDETSGTAETERQEDPTKMRESIAQTRAEMESTIEELHGRLNPAVLKEEALEQFHEAKETIKAELREAKDALKDEVKAELAGAKASLREATIGKVENMVQSAEETVKGTSHTVVEAIKQNPIPATLVGVGLAWLVLGARKNGRQGHRLTGFPDGEPRPMSRSMGVGDAVDRIGEKAEEAAHSIGDAAESAARRAGDVAQRAKAAMGEGVHRAGEVATHVMQEAEEQGKRLGTRAQQTYTDNPLAVGAAMFAVGAAVGLAVPITQKEARLVGPARDRLMDRAEEFAHGALDRVEGAAQHLADDATKAMKSQDNGSMMRGSPT
jgi:hypothetical protein